MSGGLSKSDARSAPSPRTSAPAATSPDPDHESLLVPVMRGGRRVAAAGTLAAARARLACDVEALPPEALDLHEPVPPPVRVSPRLRAFAERVTRRARPTLGDQRVDRGRSVA